MYLYRYYNLHYADREHLELFTFQIIKQTPCGAWIDLGSGKKKFINFSHRKQFAYLDKTDAFINYRARKLRQIRILRGQLERAIEASELTTDSYKEVTLTDFIIT